MSLTTDVYICDPVPIETVWDAAMAVLGFDGYEFENERKRWNPDIAVRRGRPGQGADAWVALSWSPDGPVGPKWFVSDEDDDEDWPGIDPATVIYVLDFDTTYGFSRDGMGCTDLHASYLARLPGLLGLDPATVFYRNEFTGKVHDCTPDGIANLSNAL